MSAVSPAPSSKPGAPTGTRTPEHIAIIMDGNGRWANQRGMPRAVGHERGVEALRRTVEAAQKINLKTLTVYSFSTENWRRPVSEVNALFGLLKSYIKRDLKRLVEEGVRVKILGTRHGLPPDILTLVNQAEAETSDNRKFNLCIAFNYGGREELLRAAKAMAKKVVADGLNPEAIDEADFAEFLDTGGLPDPDILIRTSGEYRLSNFLIWQAAYSELIFLDVLWPDFGEQHLREAIEIYHKRDRRFGGLASGAA